MATFSGGIRNMLFRVAVVVVLLSVQVPAQVAIYGGKRYTPENYPNAITCNCAGGMCANIRGQWRSQGWISGRGSNKQMAYVSTPAKSITTQPAGKAKAEPAGAMGYKTETRYRTVTKTRREPYTYCTYHGIFGQRKKCHTGYRNVEFQVEEPYQVRVPIEGKAEPKTAPKAIPSIVDKSKVVEDFKREPEGTVMGKLDLILAALADKDGFGNANTPDAKDEIHPALAKALLQWIAPNTNDTVYDLGCGTGELLAAATPYGCTVKGVEILEERAAMAAWRVPGATIIEGDMLADEREYTDGTIFLIHQMADLAADAYAKVPSGKLVVSLCHPIPGADNFAHTVTAAGKTLEFFVSVKA